MFCWIRNVWHIRWIGFKVHKIENYEINKISLPCFDDKIHIQSNGCDGCVPGGKNVLIPPSPKISQEAKMS